MGTPGAVISACFADLEEEQRSPVPRAKPWLYNREENRICLNASARLPNRLPERPGWNNFSWASVDKSSLTQTEFILPFAFCKAKPEHRSSLRRERADGAGGDREGKLLEKAEGEETWSVEYFQGGKKIEKSKEVRKYSIFRVPERGMNLLPGPFWGVPLSPRPHPLLQFTLVNMDAR